MHTIKNNHSLYSKSNDVVRIDSGIIDSSLFWVSNFLLSCLVRQKEYTENQSATQENARVKASKLSITKKDKYVKGRIPLLCLYTYLLLLCNIHLLVSISWNNSYATLWTLAQIAIRSKLGEKPNIDLLLV